MLGWLDNLADYSAIARYRDSNVFEEITGLNDRLISQQTSASTVLGFLTLRID